MSDIKRDIKRLARTCCANFQGENGCLLEPNGQPRCSFFREDSQARPFESGAIRCFYFERAVLPSDPDLVKKYFGQPATDVNRGNCSRCGKAIIKRSNRQKYCGTCAKLAERDAGREIMRKVRAGC